MATSKKAASKTLTGPPINFGAGPDFDGPAETDLPPQPADIDGAILAVMEQVGYVRKRKGEQLNYTYASEAALIAAIRPWMVHFGVYMRVVDIREVSEVDRPRDRGGNTRVASLTSTVRLTHAPSRTFVDVTARGEGADVSDKANNKAQTGAYKYALRQTFCIETGNDPDTSSPAVPGPTSRAPVAKQADAGDYDGPPPDEDEERAMAEQAEAGSAPEAPPAPPTSKPKLAQVHISAGVRKEFDTWVKRLIKKYPEYSLQREGKPTEFPDLPHLRGSALSLNFTEVTDDNFKKVLEAIAQHAAEKAGKAGTAPAKPKGTGAAKRPTNDEALKRAGFN